jgi:hypothetical protein
VLQMESFSMLDILLHVGQQYNIYVCSKNTSCQRSNLLFSHRNYVGYKNLQSNA